METRRQNDEIELLSTAYVVIFLCYYIFIHGITYVLITAYVFFHSFMNPLFYDKAQGMGYYLYTYVLLDLFNSNTF
jgi:hypothetical protein